ncbi:MAG TPA: complex I NDUFA9 subunit family protein [Caulobacteraceae bacterium]|nr:complex I NDUFA9 subunit family protein [Caulobacteraceae bacterium]
MQGLVTIFGGSGFVGSQIVRALARRGARIRVAVRRPWQAYRLRLLGDVGQIEIVQANVRVPETIEAALEGAEAVVYSVGTLFESGKQGFAALQADGPAHVADSAARRGIGRFVLVSAIGADPQSASRYARTKAEGEAAVRAAIPTATILRPSVVFGQGDGLFTRFAELALISPVLPLVGGGETRFQPVFVADVARAAALALEDPAAAGDTFELGGPTVYSFRQLMEITLAEIGRRRMLLPLPWGIASLIGAVGDAQAFMHGPLPMLPPPQLTSDQVRLLKVDNVVAAGAPGLAALGVDPQPLEPIIPSYLYPFRKGGQYADLTPPPTAGSGESMGIGMRGDLNAA